MSHEIISIETINTLCIILAPTTLIIGLIVGWFHKRIRAGLLFGLIGLVYYALWKLYLAVSGAIGIDKMTNIYVQVGLFVVVGAAIGAGFGLLLTSIKQSKNP